MPKNPLYADKIILSGVDSESGVYMADGTSVIDADGNIDAPVTSTNLTLSGTLAVAGASTFASTATGVSLAVTAGLTSSGATGAGIGYATGAGGAVTQITNRSTGVTSNTLSGTIQTDVTSLAAGASAEFTFTNSTIAIGDVIVVSQQSGSDLIAGVAGVTSITVVTVAAGSCEISVTNHSTTTAETGAIIINYAVIKAVAA